MVRAALEAEDEAEPLRFIGALVPGDGTGTGIDSVRRVLRHESETARLLRRAARLLEQLLGDDLNAATYYTQPDVERAFDLLRSRTEDAGVFVLLKGDLGSHHTAIEVEAFRGLALADDVAPFVVINPNDSRAAWSFTLLHELTHLLLGQTGFSGVNNSATEIEEFCNTVAAEWLLPPRALSEIEVVRGPDFVEQEHQIAEFARQRNLSRTMVAYRLLRARRIDRPAFDRLRAVFRGQWRQRRHRVRERARMSDGGPSYYVVRRHRVGPALLRFTRRMLASGAVSTTKAARILGVKPAHVGKMLRSPKAR